MNLSIRSSNVPASLNGYPVIETKPGRNVGVYVVLVVRPGNVFDPYVVASWNAACGDSWHDGDYLRSVADAAAAFKRRVF